MSKDVKLGKSCSNILRSKLDSSIIIRDIQSKNSNSVLIVDESTRNYIPANLKILKEDISGFNKDYEVISAKFVYSPHNENLIFSDEGVINFNTYIPPFWKNCDLSGESSKNVPEIYRDLLDHLVEGDNESGKYILNWMAFSLHDGYLPFLVLLSSKGTGKGLLGDIIFKLHGENNSVLVNNAMFQSDFNDYLLNKTFAFFDELLIEDNKQENKLKLLINSKHNISTKFKSSVTCKNTVRYVFASNHKYLFNITSDERRYSVPYLCNTRLSDNSKIIEKYGSLDTFYKQSLTNENILELAKHLEFRYKTLKCDMVKEFISDKCAYIYGNSLSTWEEKLLEELKNKTSNYFQKNTSVSTCLISLEHIQEILGDKMDGRRVPGRSKIEKFCEKFANHLRVVLDSKTKKRSLEINRSFTSLTR